MKRNSNGSEFSSMGFTAVKVAAISMKPRPWDNAWNVRQLENHFRFAARCRASMAVAPEGVIEGYVVKEIIKQPALAPRMLEVAEPPHGPTITRFRALARELKMCLAFGFAERVDTEVYNCAIFIDHRGRICGTHRKTQFAEGQHKSWYFNRAGKRIRTFETPWGRAGFLICNERWNPAIARTLVLDGARFLLVVSYGNRRKAQNDTVMAHARENGVPIVQASVGFNMIVSKGERVSYKWGCDQVTVSTVEIPENPSKRLARMGEREALTKLRPRMAECLKGIIKRHGRACLSPPQPKR